MEAKRLGKPIINPFWEALGEDDPLGEDYDCNPDAENTETIPKQLLLMSWQT